MLRDLDEIIVPGLTLWKPPAVLCVFCEYGLRAGDPRGAPDRGAQREREWPGSPRRQASRARAGRARLGSPPASRTAVRPARAHRGHGIDPLGLAAPRRRPDDPSRRGRVRLGTGPFLGREGGSDPGARIPDGPRRRRVPVLPDFPLEHAVAVVATVGSTSSTSVDPVREIGIRCREAEVWLHVDAAYASSAAVCPEFRWCLDGVEYADFDRREPTQVALHADGLLDALDEPPGGTPRRVCGPRRLPRRDRRPSSFRSTALPSAGDSAH